MISSCCATQNMLLRISEVPFEEHLSRMHMCLELLIFTCQQSHPLGSHKGATNTLCQKSGHICLVFSCHWQKLQSIQLSHRVDNFDTDRVVQTCNLCSLL